MRDITTAAVDEDLVGEFLADASGVDSLVRVGYADGVSEYELVLDSWLSKPCGGA
jgi:hypothetical protein